MDVFDTRRLARLALLIAMGAVLHWVESLLPAPIPLPGAKLGLANIVTLLAINLWGLSDGVYVAIGRTLLGSLLGGTFGTLSFMMSFSGATAAAVGMGLMVQLPLGLIGVSVLGAALHNAAQLAVFFLVTQYAGVWVYLPALFGLALPAGIATGLMGIYLISRLRPLQ